MNKRKAILIISILFVPLLVSSIKMETVNSLIEDDNLGSISEIGIGNPALDFTITDVDTRENYTLSDFLGQAVLLDLWATWCGPCEISLPIIEEFYIMYPENVLQIISIDVDETESDALVSDFRSSHDMDWIVGVDYYQNITTNVGSQYGTGYIPTFVLIDQSGDVVWNYIGTTDLWNQLRTAISAIIPDETVNPEFLDYSYTNDSELSIFYPRIKVSANISDNYNLKKAEILILNGGLQSYNLVMTKVGDFYIINQWVTLETQFIYQYTSLELQIKATDYFGNSNTTETYFLPITQYIDSGPPTISDIVISYEKVSEAVYEVTVYAIINEDLILERADIQLKKGTTTVRTVSFEDYNGTHMAATGSVLYNTANPDELIVVIILEDAAGNEVISEHPVVDVTEKSSYGVSLIFAGILFSVAVFQIFRRRK